MSILSILTDEYEHRARLWPALLVSLPLTLAVISWFPDLSGMQIVAGFLVYCGFTGLLAQLGRDQGKKKEPWLFQQWGGKPTTQLLRHCSDHLDATTKERYRAVLSAIVPDMSLPTPAEEAADPVKADAKYDSCALFLREKTRDKKAFPLVFAENVNFGFRRNLWGMKPAGIGLSALAVVVAIIAAIINSENGRPPALATVATVVNGLMLVWWVLRINVDWIRIPAFAYAERLLSACDVLRPRGEDNRQRIITE
ncbi:MAG: hypothetical protein HQ567_30575 [Candidatus Nealsonbacteria bacterium]|nr:hypothetical protein [Candidatus Nealsonbacteria bacterium]